MTHPMDRRAWLRATSTAALGCTVWGRQVWAAPADAPRTLLVFLRGAYDASTLLQPLDGASRTFYEEARPRLAVPRPDGSATGALALDSDWALAPAVQESLGPLWRSQQLAFVPFAGNDDLSRSHFETQDTVELGLGTGWRGARTGLLNRLAGELGLPSGPGLEVLGFTDQLPLILQGPQAARHASLKTPPRAALDPRQTAQIERMYAGTPWAAAVRDGFQTRHEVLREMTGEMAQANRGAVSTSAFETEARRIGHLMRERVALGFVDVGGWDTHANQGGAEGVLPSRLADLARGLAGLAEAMGPAAWQRCTVVVISEFGRTWRENGTRGTDHGHGTAFWVMGGALRGGALRGEQLRITPDTLHQQRDWPVLNEYRAVLGGLWQRQFGLSPAQLARIFPGGPAPRDLGLL